VSGERPILLAAGGTGGHLFPAEALAIALRARGRSVELATDSRALRYGAEFPADAIHAIPAATPSGGSAFGKIMAGLTLARGVVAARGVVKRANPAVVVGFGGYPTVPPLLAAQLAGVPTIIHEQNAVMGRANRFLAGRASAIALGFPRLGGTSADILAKTTHVGNPVRPAVVEAAKTEFVELGDGDAMELLVTGGSQGARVMSDIVPPAVELLAPARRARLRVTQQARAEDVSRVKEFYARLGVAATVESFFNDLPARMAKAHLVVARAGASTVSELAVIGRDSILVPLPGALDQDQAANAAILGGGGAATIVPQAAFTPARLAAEIAQRLDNPAALRYAADAARALGVPNAAERLADFVISRAGQ
jgi:UDP-N-acetylglucosamine--N-acetylmuramyl-(pentapeptide) pyrophosphoryl-undecaprenol N-acetylglucosamine transferase